MLKQEIEEINGLLERIGGAWELLKLDTVKDDIAATEWQVQQPDFWNNPEKAQKVSKRLGGIKEFYGEWEKLLHEARDLKEYAELAAAEVEDEASEKEVRDKLASLVGRFEKMEFATLMGDEHDGSDAILAIHAGAGGTDAQDWAEMLLRMFTRYAERKAWGVKVLDISHGGEAGIKSVTLAVEGRYAYGHLKCEAGVHRLVRLSPFNADQLRQTSFALVEVLPDLGEMDETKIDPKDVRVDTFLSSGHGGQGVQTTYSAVRLTHIPTGLVVSCQNERSQTQNKETAMRILQARIHAIYLKQREEEKLELRGEHHSAEWGSQIRSYVLHPYKMVKDHRTKHETADPEVVLDGDLDAFVEAYLRFVKGHESAGPK